MKVIFEDNKIKIRRKEGVVLVIDSGVPFGLFEIVKHHTNDMGIPFRIGALSHDKEIDKEINENTIQDLEQMLRNRGRYITPLIEGFFGELKDKEYDLIILHSEKVYDLDDYKSELSAKFGRKPIIEDTREDRTNREREDLFKSKIFDFSIGDIELFLNSAVPLEWDDRFTVSLDMSKKQFILKKSDTSNDIKFIDIGLKTRGKTKEAYVEIKANNLIFSGEIKNITNFIAPQWKYLSPEDKQVFIIHLEEYKKSNFDVECPLCKKEKKHNFEKPFFCSMLSGDVLAGDFTQGVSILKSLRSYNKGFVLFRIDGDKIEYLTSEKDGLEFEDLRFIFVLNKQAYEVTCRDKSLEIREVAKVHPNLPDLYEFEKDNFVYLI